MHERRLTSKFRTSRIEGAERLFVENKSGVLETRFDTGNNRSPASPFTLFLSE